MWIDKDNVEFHWDSRKLWELFSSDSHEIPELLGSYCQNVAMDDKLFDLESFENPAEWINHIERSIFKWKQLTLIESPKFNSWITCFISPCNGWFDEPCVDIWKLPGTRAILNDALIRHPNPLFSGILIVFSWKPTSWRPRSSWMSMPRSKKEHKRIYHQKRSNFFTYNHKRLIKH